MLEQSLREQLSALGHRDGETITIDWHRYKTWEASSTMAVELVRARPDLVIVFGTPPARKMVDASKTLSLIHI